MVGESYVENSHFKIPLYADGFPGVMFQQSTNGFFLKPKNKLLSEFFLYGQTLKPISLEVQGPYRFVVFQFYPFALKYLLDINPIQLNDKCYDLLQISTINTHQYHQKLTATKSLNQQIETISDMIEELIGNNHISENAPIQKVVKEIIEARGQVKIKSIRDKVFLTERTLERKFKNQTGLTPKQFAKIIQFQTSLSKLSQADFDKLTHVGLDSGFTDQSHFIRVFKEYTGKTPSYYLKSVGTAK